VTTITAPTHEVCVDIYRAEESVEAGHRQPMTLNVLENLITVWNIKQAVGLHQRCCNCNLSLQSITIDYNFEEIVIVIE